MERGVVIGGVLIAVSMLIAVVLNNYARRDMTAVGTAMHATTQSAPSNACTPSTAPTHQRPNTPCGPIERDARRAE